MCNTKVVTSPFKSTAYFHISEITYFDDLHKILQLLLLKLNNDHQLFPVCFLPPQYFSSRGIVDFLGYFLQTPGRQSTEPRQLQTTGCNARTGTQTYLVACQEIFTEKLVCLPIPLHIRSVPQCPLTVCPNKRIYKTK